MRPNEWQLPSHALLPTLLAPFVSSLGLLRDGEEWVVGEQGAEEVRARVRRARAELEPLLAGPPRAENEAAEQTTAFHVHNEQQEARSGDSTQPEVSGDGSLGDEEDHERTAALPVPLTRQKTMHPAHMPVRPMPTMPTTVRHDRSTFRTDNSRLQPRQRPQSPPEQSDVADVPYSSRTEAAAHPKTLSHNVAGDRRALPVALPTAFLSTAPTIEAADGGLAPFSVQPAVLDVGPLLVGCTYTASLLLTNTSPYFARASTCRSRPQAPTPPPRPQRPSISHSPFGVEAWPPDCRSPSLPYWYATLLAFSSVTSWWREKGAACACRVCAECMDDAEEWRSARVQRDRLSAGEIGGLMASTALPGSLKVINDSRAYGQAKEVSSSTAEEESKQQMSILRSAVLTKHGHLRNKALQSR